MRSFVVLVMFAASLAQAGFRDYEETRELKLSSAGIERLYIHAGAGSMDINGVDGIEAIEVMATIGVSNANAEKAANVIAKRMQLSLDKSGDAATLRAMFEDGLLGFGADAYIALDVNVPKGLHVKIDDGAGSIDVIGVDGDVFIDDGAGSIDVISAANVEIDDGSGSIDVEDATGDVRIVDGSGSITVRDIGGSVTIDDGSGGIRVNDVENNLTIVADGSGGLSFRDIRGTVESEK